MVKLAFDEATNGVACLIEEAEPWRAIGVEPHLLAQPPASRVGYGLVRAWMAAASIRPEPSEVVFAGRTTMEQGTPARVEDEDAECPVEMPGRFMGFKFRHRTDRIVLLIDQDHVHGVRGGALGDRVSHPGRSSQPEARRLRLNLPLNRGRGGAERIMPRGPPGAGREAGGGTITGLDLMERRAHR